MTTQQWAQQPLAGDVNGNGGGDGEGGGQPVTTATIIFPPYRNPLHHLHLILPWRVHRRHCDRCCNIGRLWAMEEQGCGDRQQPQKRQGGGVTSGRSMGGLVGGPVGALLRGPVGGLVGVRSIGLFVR